MKTSNTPLVAVVLARGRVNLNAGLRYELVDQSSLPQDSHAPTIRTRFGFTTAPLYGFQGMIEGENITVIGPDHNFNAAGSNGQGGRPVVADPPTTELNQAWISYSYSDWLAVRAGRQRIVLDNHRFIGDVGWRQNMQTFDAVTHRAARCRSSRSSTATSGMCGASSATWPVCRPPTATSIRIRT